MHIHLQKRNEEIQCENCTNIYNSVSPNSPIRNDLSLIKIPLYSPFQKTQARVEK